MTLSRRGFTLVELLVVVAMIAVIMAAVTCAMGEDQTFVVRRIRRALAENNIPFDKKRFSPHITLIRKASGDMPGLAPEPVSMTVETISLMRSDRGRNGMIYTEIGTVEGEDT